MAKRVVGRRPAKRAGSRAGTSATRPAKWTVMVYMAATRDDLQTERAAIRDLRELQRVGSTDDIQVVVQLDRNWPGTPETYVVRKGVSERVHVPPPNPKAKTLTRQSRRRTGDRKSSGSVEALSQFLDWSRTNHRAERYLLVLWGHAYGLGFGRDHGDPLTLQELSSTLKAFGKGRRLDLLGANACAMSYAEAAFELQDAADYLVAPEITMPFSGWPYAAILQRMGDRLEKKAGLDAEDLGRLIIDEFMRSFRRKGVALSLLSLPKADVLSTDVETLARVLRPVMSNPALSQQVADAFLDSAHGDVRPLVDLFDLCVNLEKVSHPGVVESASRLRAHLEPGQGRLIVKHEADADFEGLHGLGIFAPAVTSGADLVRLEFDKRKYQDLALMQQTGDAWTELVYVDLAEVLEPMNAEIDELVMRSGASSRDDREGVGQLLLSAKRSFDRLELAVGTAKEELMPALHGPSSGGSGIGSRAAPPLFLRLLVDEAAHERLLSVPLLPAGAQRESFTLSLRGVEIALASTERTIRRVLTNGSLGLGADGGIKPGFGQGDLSVKLGFGPPGGGPIKPGLGDADGGIKPGFGDVDGGIKPGFGDVDGGIKPGFGTSMTSDGVVLTGEMMGVANLFRVVAASLGGLEEALARLEQIVLGPFAGAGMSIEEARQRTAEQADRAFRDLDDRIVVSRQTCFWVLRHPIYGLGPVAGDSSSVDRRHIASVGGLNTRYLQLL